MKNRIDKYTYYWQGNFSGSGDLICVRLSEGKSRTTGYYGCRKLCRFSQ